MDPHVLTSSPLIKRCLVHSETTGGICPPVSESHPSIAPDTAGDIVAAVDELATREAHELELAFTAGLAHHGPVSGSSSY